MDPNCTFNIMPKQGVLDFYGYYNLEESQQLLWELLKIAISGKRNQISKKEWANLISFYENLDDFLTQSYGTIWQLVKN